MSRLLVLTILLGAAGRAAPVLAQDFPAPGTGLLSFERVGDERRMHLASFAFSGDGVLFSYSPTSAADSIFRFEPALNGPPTGRWRSISRASNGTRTVTTIGATADTLLVGKSGAIFRSVDQGITWTLVNGIAICQGVCTYAGPSTPDGFSVLPTGHPHAGRLLAGGGILYSDDRGATWTQATRSFPGEQGNAAAFAALPSGRVLMAGDWGVAASDDGGASYAVTPLWGDYHYAAYSITALATPGSRQSGAPACGLADASLCDGAVVVGIDATQEYVRAWRTNDGGRSWSASQPLPEPYDGVGTGATAGVVALPPGPDGLGRGLFVGRRGVLYRTMDGGQTWEVIGRMPVNNVSHWTILARIGPDGHLWVATIRNGPVGDYMYRSVEPVEAAFIVAGEAPPSPPPDLSLAVRPNPTSEAATVTLTLEAPSARVTVRLLDALGRAVADLHDGPLATGEHALRVSTTGLSPGVYVVRAEAGGAAVSTPLTIAR